MDSDAEDSSFETNYATKMSIELGLLTRAHGSARFNQGDTSVLAAVYGPLEAKQHVELIDRCSVHVTYRSKHAEPQDPTRYAHEGTLASTCSAVIQADQYPRSMVHVILHESQNSGSFLAACINACCLALQDSGLAMRCLVAAVTCTIDDKGVISLHPNRLQEASAKALLTFAFDNRVYSNLITAETIGACSRAEFQKCLELAQKESESIFALFRNEIRIKITERLS